MSTTSSAIPSLTAGARRSAGSTDLNGTASTGWCALPTCATMMMKAFRATRGAMSSIMAWPLYIPVQRENPQYQAFRHPFKLTASHGRYLLVNPGLWVRRSRSVKCDAMFSPSGAFPGVDAIIGGRYPAMVMKLAAQ